MHHAFLAGCKFNKRAKLLDAHHRAGKYLSGFKIGDNDLHHVNGLINHGLIRTTHRHCSVIAYVNLDTRSLNNRIDGLATLSHHITDLLRIDLNLHNLRRILADFPARPGNHGLHTGIHNKLSGFPASADSAFHNRSCQTMDLNIHLDGCNPFRRTCHLEIHIAEEIFQSLDVGQQYIVIVRISCYQATGNTCHHLFHRHPCRHQGHTGSAGGRHRCGTVGLECLRNRADRIGEFFRGRQYRQKRPFCQSPMTDLTTPRPSGRLCLAHRIGREIIVMHIAFADFILIQSVQPLLLGEGRQRTYIADLGLSSGKHGRTMHSGNQIHLCRQRTDLGHLTPVRTLSVFQNHFPHGFLLILVNRLIQYGQPFLIVRKCLFQTRRNLSDILLTHLLYVCEYRILHL